MTVIDVLVADIIKTPLTATDKPDVLRELVQILKDAGQIDDFDAVLDAIQTREDQMSTGLLDGIAVPHGRTDAVDELVCAVGLRPAGVDFGAQDGEPTRVFVLVLTPPGGADPYLQFVASLMGALETAGTQALLQADTPEQLQRALTQA